MAQFLGVFKRTALVVAAIAGAAAAILIAVIALAVHMNDRAATDAADLCRRVAVGSAESEVLALARSTRARHVQAPGRHVFSFQGWVFNAVSCEVAVSNNRVTAKSIVVAED